MVTLRSAPAFGAVHRPLRRASSYPQTRVIAILPSAGPGTLGPMTTNISEPTLTLSTPADVLAAVPYLLGFHPADSLVVIGMSGPLGHGRIEVSTRWNLPLSPGALQPVVAMFRRERVTHAIIVGYGPGPLVTPAVDEARALAEREGIRICEALRAHEGRFWSYVCDCCDAEGTPFDISSSQVAAAATVQGLVALPDRESLKRTVESLAGPVRLAMRRATAEAADELRARLAATADHDLFARGFVEDGLIRVRSAILAYTAGSRVDDRTAARIGLDLTVIRIRDEAWTLIDQTAPRAHLTLWKDLARRLEPRFAPPAAALLGVAAWQVGDCALASIALERALSIDPAYSMAKLLTHALGHFISPQALRERMPTPTDLDTAMGAPRASWLLPLLHLLDDTAEP